MRGSRFFAFAFFAHLGIIPAHAGLTVTKAVSSAKNRDHPRACGAHVNEMPEDDSMKGSSPRMRGSQYISRFFDAGEGIIPAHAGLTTISSFAIAQ